MAAQLLIGSGRLGRVPSALRRVLLRRARKSLAGFVDRTERRLGNPATVLHDLLHALADQVALDGCELLHRRRTGQLGQAVEIALPLLLRQFEPAPRGILQSLAENGA